MTKPDADELAARDMIIERGAELGIGAPPPYDDTDPDLAIIAGEWEQPADRAKRKAQAKKDAAAAEKLDAQLTRDPDSTQGTISYAPGQHPDELAAAEAAAQLTDIERTEQEYGFTFGTPDEHDDARERITATVRCTNPDCPNTDHVALNADTPTPVYCGTCGTLLLCEHDPITIAVTTGTLSKPIERTTVKCRKCNTIISTSDKELPPINLGDLPAEILEVPLGDGEGAGTL